MIMLQELDAPAQCLFLRLFQRKRSWFRMAALSYTEVPDVDAAVACLVAAEFASTSDAASLEGKCLVSFSYDKDARAQGSRCT